MLVKSRLRTRVRDVASVASLLIASLGGLLAVATQADGQQAVPAAGGVVFRAYPCPAERAAAVAEGLKREFASMPTVGIAADVRVGQILVTAPEMVQRQIAQRFAPPAQNGGPNPVYPVRPNGQLPNGQLPNGPQTDIAIRSAPPGASQAAKALAVQLRHVSTQQVESALAGALGQRLTPVPSAGGAIRNYRLALSGGAWIDLGIHHQNGRVTIQGPGTAVDSCAHLLRTLDTPNNNGDDVRLVSYRAANRTALSRALHAIRTSTAGAARDNPMVTMLFQQPPRESLPESATPTADAPPPAGQPTGVPPPPGNGESEGGLVGPVRIEQLEGLDTMVLIGRKKDVEQVLEAIAMIEKISLETTPEVDVLPLRYVDCEAMAALITPLYEQVYLPRQGAVSITALVRPNAILLIGRKENVQTARDLIARLDQPVAPQSTFRVFRLRHASAVTVQTTLAEYFGMRAGVGQAAQVGQTERVGLVGPNILVQVDYRSNSVIVRAGQGDMAEAAKLIQQLDTPDNYKENAIQIFYLENTMAEDVQQILEQAIMDQGAPRTGAPGQAAAARATGAEQSAMKLKLETIDAKGKQILTSGVLIDVRVTADVRANSLVVSAPADSMELIGALIRQLDRLPAAQAVIKVFTIENGDAASLTEMLQTIFAEEGTTEGPAVRTGAGEGESSLVRLRFAVDTRTNSILASGGTGDLRIVEAILLRLDDSEIRQRTSKVYRLKNAPANDVATAINNFLSSERQVQQIEPGLVSPFEQIQREVVVVPEPISNTLILSATKRFFEEIEKLIEELDKQPPMVIIQVVIAQIELNDTDEFGIELGLQDSILFDRSLLGDLVTTAVSSATPGTGVVITNDVIQAASNTPGFLFNNQQLGNSGSTGAIGSRKIVGPQALSHFGLGRMNNEVNFGGLVLSASSENVSLLIRALQECRNTTVLSRPQIMTLDNQPAYVVVGERVPIITGVSVDETTGRQTNTIEQQDIGLILAVTPRVNPDGLVVMEIDVENSKLGPESEGVPVSVSVTGEAVRYPRIETTTAQTTISAHNGQTVVLGGLITKSKEETHRRVPYLADIPLLGDLFRYDLKLEQRTEMLIILTPRIVKSKEDAEVIKQVEASRMSWCLSDVLAMHDDPSLRGRKDEWSDSETQVIYPDLDPSGQMVPVPAPERAPDGPEMDPLQKAEPQGALPQDSLPLEPTTGPSAPMPAEGAYYGPRYPAGQVRRQWPADPGRVQRAGYSERGAVVPSAYQAVPRYSQPSPATAVRPPQNVGPASLPRVGYERPVPRYPQSQYPQSQYPQSQYPQSQYPQSQYPQPQYRQTSMAPTAVYSSPPRARDYNSNLPQYR